MAERRTDRHEEGPARRQVRQTEAPEHTEPDREQNLPDQERFGNSFLLDAMRGGEAERGAPIDPMAAPETDLWRDYGGIEDDDPDHGASDEDAAWFGARWHRPEEEEDPEGAGHGGDEPGVPPEDGAWIDGLPATGTAWLAPAPQPLPEMLDAGLRRWLVALLPPAGQTRALDALLVAIEAPSAIQDPEGEPLLGIAAAAAIGAATACEVAGDPSGHARIERGLGAAAAPAIAPDPTRRAAQLVEMGPRAPVPAVPPDPWLTATIRLRLGTSTPPSVDLDDPRPPEPDGEAPDLDAVLAAELGPGPDPREILRGVALETCEAQARWAVTLRADAASVAWTLEALEVPGGSLGSALDTLDAEVQRTLGLLREIADAARTGRVPIRGLRNGLHRAAIALAAARDTATDALARCATEPAAADDLPAGPSTTATRALEDGRPTDALGRLDPVAPSEAVRLAVDAVAAIDALARGDSEAALAIAAGLATAAELRQDGVGLAHATLLSMAAHRSAGRTERAATLREEVGARLVGASAWTGLSLLSRWRPPEPPLDQAGWGR